MDANIASKLDKLAVMLRYPSLNFCDGILFIKRRRGKYVWDTWDYWTDDQSEKLNHIDTNLIIMKKIQFTFKFVNNINRLLSDAK
ncbi:MAG: hypothetical protein ACLTMR_02240 [Faecalibacillus sp.]